MGHSDPSVTLREYGHLFEGVQEQLTEKLDDLREATVQDTRKTHGHAKDTKPRPIAVNFG